MTIEEKAIKEQPILFSAAMVKAIIVGDKTQTRRVLKRSTEFKGPYNPDYLETTKNSGGWSKICPYGQVGSKLWVRETWGIGGDILVDPCLNYRVGRQSPILKGKNGFWYPAHARERMVESSELLRVGMKTGWRPSIFMPRWASRITLEITDVRVQRLQEISESDAQAEGISVGARYVEPGADPLKKSCVHCGQFRKQHVGSALGCFGGSGTCWNPNTYRGGFGILWDSINGKKYPWSSNPWLWCLSFKRIDGE